MRAFIERGWRAAASSLIAASLIGLGLATTAHAGGAPAEKPTDFNRQIRPLLSGHCFACHGPDAAERQADLRLDTEAGARELKDGHAAIVPGKPEESELLKRVTSTDPDLRMPPADAPKQLTPEQIELIRRWIAEGAKWQQHWAYDRPAMPSVPTLAAGNSVGSPIDPFIRAKLLEAGLQTSAEADRVTLIRRLSFDLLGLPPTVEQVDAFVNDASPQAYEKQVDQLLASPHFGERMAMYWLDVVRFADTNGYHGDNHRDVALYRDYVIDAFNQNKPFDCFTREQLAGDLLPNASRETRIASGYNHLLMTTREGGAQPKEYTAKYAADRVRNVSVAWLGATLGCAECHDHKFDPYLTKDFYSFAAFFADVKEVPVGVQEQVQMPNDEQTQRVSELAAAMAAARQQLETATPELAAAQAAWEAGVQQQIAAWKALQLTGAIAASGASITIANDGNVLVSGPAAETDLYTIVAPVNVPNISALRIEVLPHEQLPGKGPGRAANGNFVLSEIRCNIAPRANPAAQTPLVLKEASVDYTQDPFTAAGAIDGNPTTGWAIAPKTGQQHVAVFEVQGAPVGQDAILTIELLQNHGQGHTLGHFKLSATSSPSPVRALESLPPAIYQILTLAPEKRNPEQQQALPRHYRAIAPALEPQRVRLAAAEKAKADFEAQLPTTLVSMTVEPRTMRVLPRGNWLSDDGEVVAPAVPSFLPQLELGGRRANRLDLANWMTAGDNPLVARVFVNRLWKLAFGQGIVKSLDDFGSQGVAPTHPELLDWLAIEFVQSGWDVKHLLKLMVMSETYRQSSVCNEAQRQADPYNKSLARQSRFRLDAEMVRDNALAASGLLSPRIGGPSVKPYQPPGYWSHLNFPTREYETDRGESLYRRGLYTYWCRTFLHPSLAAFDAPTREECTVERSRSNTPLQALVLLNDPIYIDAARAFAKRIIAEGGPDTTARLGFAYLRALSRVPTEREFAVLTELLEKHRSQFTADPAAAAQLLGIEKTSPTPAAEQAELAAWTSVVRVLLNLHEMITRA